MIVFALRAMADLQISGVLLSRRGWRHPKIIPYWGIVSQETSSFPNLRSVETLHESRLSTDMIYQNRVPRISASPFVTRGSILRPRASDVMVSRETNVVPKAFRLSVQKTNCFDTQTKIHECCMLHALIQMRTTIESTMQDSEITAWAASRLSRDLRRRSKMRWARRSLTLGPFLPISW